MKKIKIIPTFLLATLTSSSLLLAQSEKQATGYMLKNRLEAIGYRLEEEKNKETDNRKEKLMSENQIGQRAELTANCQLPTANCNNSDQDLKCYLMMDPAELKNIQEGIEDLKGVVGSPGKAPISTTAFAHSPSSSSAAMSEIRGSEAAAILTHEETAEGNATNTYLEDEICHNIYTSCLAKVAAMSQSRNLLAGGNAEAGLQEAKEWDAAEKKAKRDVDKSKRALEKAGKEKNAAEKKLDSSKASIHGKAYVDEAYYNFQVKELAEELAEARVVTAEATLMAIEVRGTAQSAGAEADLAEAREEERDAAEALEKATRNTSKTFAEETQSSTSSPSGKQNQVTQYTPRKNSMDAESVNFAQGPINLPVSPQRPLSPVPPKLSVPEFKTTATEQTFATPSIPVAIAVEFNPANNFTSVAPLSPFKLSEEKAAKEIAETLAKKEKTTTAFETEFSAMIKSAKAQVEESIKAAEEAREKAEKQGVSEKAWSDAIKKAGKAESAYTHLIRYYKMYTEQAAEHYEGGILNAKRSQYNFALQDAEEEKGHWTTEVAECREKKEALHNGTIEKTLEQTRAVEVKVTKEREVALVRESEELLLAQATQQEDALLVQEKALQQEKDVLKQQHETTLSAEAASKVEVNDRTADETVQEKVDVSLLSLSPFMPKTWYDEQIEVTEQAKIAALEKIAKASTELEEAQKALKAIDDQVQQEENSEESKSKLAAVKRRFQARLQELQAAGELADQKVQECQNSLKAFQYAEVRAKEEIQKAKKAKEYALKTTYLQFNEVGKDLVEGIELDRKKYGRDQRLLEAAATVDQERIEKTAVFQAAEKAENEKIAKVQAAHQMWNECVKERMVATEKCVLASTAVEQYLSAASNSMNNYGNSAKTSRLRMGMGQSKGVNKNLFDDLDNSDSSDVEQDFLTSQSRNIDNDIFKQDSFSSFGQGQWSLTPKARLRMGNHQLGNYTHTSTINSRTVEQNMLGQSRDDNNRYFNALDVFGQDSSISDSKQLNSRISEEGLFPFGQSSEASNSTATVITVVEVALVNIERSLAAAQKGAVADTHAGVSLEQFWTSNLSALAREQNAWKSIINSKHSLNPSQNKEEDSFSEEEVYSSGEELDASNLLRYKTQGKYSANPSVKYTTESTNHQSDLSHLNKSIKRPTVYSPQPKASIQPVGRIVTKQVTVKTPSQQTIQLNRTTGAQSDHFIQSAPPQEVGSERLQAELEEAQNATKKADQAFQALKMARDAAYAGIVESSSQQQSQQKIASLQTPEGKEAQVKEAAEQADAIAFAKTRELQAVEQVAIAKKASEAARDEDDWSEQSAWGRVAQLTEQAVKQWQKASDALTQGKKERATLLRKAAEQSEVFAEELKEVVQAYASGDLAKAESLEKTACIGMYLSKVSIYSLNSEEATASNQPELAVMWCKTAKQYEELAEHARQVASTRSSKNYTDYKQVYNSRMRNAEYLEKAAIAQEKVIKAMTANQPKLVALWLKTSNLYEESSEYYRQKLAAIAAGNTADSERLNRVAGSAEHYAQRLEKTSIALERGIQAETINKGEEAALWMKSAKYYEEAAEYYGKSREAELNENTDDKERFWEMYRSADRGAQLLEQAAIAQEKITQAKIEGRRKEATQWIEVAKQYEGVAALILREGPSINIDPKDLKQSVSCMESRANKLKKALIAQEKATQATTENQPEIADLWLKIVKQYEESAEYDRQLANTYLNGNTNNRDCLSRAMNTMEDSVKCLEQAAIARGKTINTRVVNQRALSGLWLEIAEQYEVTADYHYQEAKLARRDKNAQYDAEYMSYWNCKNNLRDSFDALKKATKATIANRGEIAAPWLEIAKCYKVSVEYYAQAADAALRDPNNHDRFYKAGYLLVDSANQLKEAAIIHEKATQATVANEKEIVGLCLQAAKEYKKSAEYYRQASNAKLNRNETDFYRFKQAGESAKKSAEALRTQVYELEKN